MPNYYKITENTIKMHPIFERCRKCNPYHCVHSICWAGMCEGYVPDGTEEKKFEMVYEKFKKEVKNYSDTAILSILLEKYSPEMIMDTLKRLIRKDGV